MRHRPDFLQLWPGPLFSSSNEQNTQWIPKAFRLTPQFGDMSVQILRRSIENRCHAPNQGGTEMAAA